MVSFKVNDCVILNDIGIDLYNNIIVYECKSKNLSPGQLGFINSIILDNTHFTIYEIRTLDNKIDLWYASHLQKAIDV